MRIPKLCLPWDEDGLWSIEVFVQNLLALVNSVIRCSILVPVIADPGDPFHTNLLHCRPLECWICERNSGAVADEQEFVTSGMDNNRLTIVLARNGYREPAYGFGCGESLARRAGHEYLELISCGVVGNLWKRLGEGGIGIAQGICTIGQSAVAQHIGLIGFWIRND